MALIGPEILDPSFWIAHPWMALLILFQIWMLVDAIRRQEWIWAIFIFFFSALSAALYYFMVYRSSGSAITRGFELPGAGSRQRIKELEAQIHHLDKAHHHLQLGDVYFQKGNLKKAEACYRAALERDPQDIDTRAHLGQCLLRQNKTEDAKVLLQQVCSEDPKHDYGHSLMAYAECLTALGQIDAAIQVWRQVLHDHNYARARVQLAELYLGKGQPDLAKAELREVLQDDQHAPSFQRKRDRVWVKKAKRLL